VVQPDSYLKLKPAYQCIGKTNTAVAVSVFIHVRNIMAPIAHNSHANGVIALAK